MPIAPVLQRFIDDELALAPALIGRVALGTIQLLGPSKETAGSSERIHHAEIVTALAAPIGGERHLVLVMNVQPASLMSAAVMRAAARAVAPARPADVTVRHGAEQLKAWERPPAAVAPEGAVMPDESRGRWLWLVALILMVLERVIARRARRPRSVAQAEVRDVARVA